MHTHPLRCSLGRLKLRVLAAQAPNFRPQWTARRSPNQPPRLHDIPHVQAVEHVSSIVVVWV